MSCLIQSPAACFHTREMDLHPGQVESEAEITASNNNSLPRSVCQEQLAERTLQVTYHQHRGRLELWKQRVAVCLPQINSRMRPRANLACWALPVGGGGRHPSVNLMFCGNRAVILSRLRHSRLMQQALFKCQIHTDKNVKIIWSWGVFFSRMHTHPWVG